MASDPPEVHMASLDTYSYILAADRGAAEAALVAVRYGSPIYNGQFIARADSGISELADLKGKTFARPDPMSSSGWIIPMLTMRAAGINPETDLRGIIDAGGHIAVAAAVYNKDVDAGATYMDARTSLEEDHPDIMDKVVVIKITADIPNDGLQFVPSLPKEMRDKIVNALLEIVATNEGKDALEIALEWNTLEKHDDTFYDIFRQLLRASGLNTEEFRRLTNR
jgi:phosphonate transport system substrate-binding protein